MSKRPILSQSSSTETDDHGDFLEELHHEVVMGLGIKVMTQSIILKDVNESDIERWRLALVAYLKGKKEMNLKKITTEMAIQWKHNNFAVSPVRGKYLKFQFQNEKFDARALLGQTWVYKNKVVPFKRWPLFASLKTLKFDKVPVWIRISGIPRELAINKNIWEAASKLGHVLAVDKRKRKLGKWIFVRAKILFKHRLPLIPSVMCEIENVSAFLFQVKYEDIPFYCPTCGIMGHNSEIGYKVKVIMIKKFREMFPFKAQPRNNTFIFFLGNLNAYSWSEWIDSSKLNHQEGNGNVEKQQGMSRMNVLMEDYSLKDSEVDEKVIEWNFRIKNMVQEEDLGGFNKRKLENCIIIGDREQGMTRSGKRKPFIHAGKYEAGLRFSIDDGPSKAGGTISTAENEQHKMKASNEPSEDKADQKSDEEEVNSISAKDVGKQKSDSDKRKADVTTSGEIGGGKVMKSQKLWSGHNPGNAPVKIKEEKLEEWENFIEDNPYKDTLTFGEKMTIAGLLAEVEKEQGFGGQDGNVTFNEKVV